MLNNSAHNEKMLKVFAGIRCLNKDQLPRYLDGRLTDIEKHLVEQHLVDCDLCFEALQSLQHEKFREQYPILSAGVQQYIRESIKPVSQLQKMERYLRKARKRENFLIYFWLVAFVVLGAGGIYIMQAHDFKRPVIARPVTPVLNTAAVTNNPPLPADEPVKKPASAPLAIAAKPGTTAPVTGQKSAGTPATTPKPATVKKDSAKANHPVVPPLKKPADSIKKTPLPPKAPDSLKKTEKKEQAPKSDTPANTAKNTTPEKTDKETKDPDSSKDKPAEKSAASPSQPPTADEFLYKAAMVYQQQGDMNEAISRLKRLTDNDGRIGEMARYQLGVCYRNKGQMGKARRMFKDVVRLNGSMKSAAQQALDNM